MNQNQEEREEVRAAHVAQLGQDIYMRQRAALLAGDKVAIRDLSNGLLEQLTNGGVLAGLLRTGFTAAAEVTGRAFLEVMVDEARRQAEEDAEAQVVAAERAAQQDPDNFTPSTRRQEIQREWLAGGSG